MPRKVLPPVDRSPGLPSDEDGYLLLGVLVMVFLLTLSLAVAAPVIATQVRRDKEAEFYHRGQQYSRAVRLYYRQFGRYPLTIDQLQETNKIRFLRKRYLDPMTGQDFRIIHVGEARVQVPGFYGGDPIIPNNPNNSIPVAGGVPGTNPGTTRYGVSGNSAGSSSSPFSSSSNPFSSPSNPFGSSGNSFGPAGNSSDGSSVPQTGAGGASGFGSGSSGGSAFGASSSTNSGSNSDSSGTATSGQTLGGLGIIGVSSKSDHVSIRVYRKQTKYNQWEFVYDAAQEVLGATSMGPLQTATNLNSPGSGTSLGSGGVTQPTAPPLSQTPTQQ